MFPALIRGSCKVTVKNVEQYFPLVLFVMLYKVVGVTIQMKATEQYFPAVLFIMLYKVFLIVESVDKILV